MISVPEPTNGTHEDIPELGPAIEALLFARGDPVSEAKLAAVLGVKVSRVREALEGLQTRYEQGGHGLRIEAVAGGYQIVSAPEYHPWIEKLFGERKEGRLSPAALETLAVIAYRQPINKAELEAVRGVICGPILKTLLERRLVRIVGREDSLGRPLLYGTTRQFLERFGLSSLKDLPEPDGGQFLASSEPET